MNEECKNEERRNEESKALINALEAKLNKAAITPREKIALALKYIDTRHDEIRGLQLLDEAVARGDLRARLWRAYYHVHLGMTKDEMLKAKQLLQLEGVDDPQFRAGALLLLPFILDELGEGNVELEISMLKEAAQLFPSWVFPHWFLARGYERAGLYAEAACELELARSMVLDETEQIDPLEDEFEGHFTGRAFYGVKSILANDLERIKERIRSH